MPRITTRNIPDGKNHKIYDLYRGQIKAAWPGKAGGNVDITLGVVVQQATGTLMAFKPEYIHGTTHLVVLITACVQSSSRVTLLKHSKLLRRVQRLSQGLVLVRVMLQITSV
jgi:hypothetical protein